jgi:hypothetical protein
MRSRYDPPWLMFDNADRCSLPGPIDVHTVRGSDEGGSMAARLKVPGLVGELASEFAGTMILILFGCGVVAQVVAGGIGDHDSIA